MIWDTSGRLVFVLFLEEFEDIKKTFRNQLIFSGFDFKNVPNVDISLHCWVHKNFWGICRYDIVPAVIWGQTGSLG